MDLIYIGLALLFFTLSWGLIRLCERLGRPSMNPLYLVGGVTAVLLLIYLLVALLKPEKFS